MTEALLIHVGSNPSAAINWLIWSAKDAEIIASGTLDSANELTSLTEKGLNREVVLLLPAAQVQLKTVALPSKWGRKLEQALPFIIEDEIACDIDDVFIAVNKPLTQDNQHFVEVAVVAEHFLQHWLDALNEYQLQPTKVVPDALLLPPPEQPSHISGIELNNNWLFRAADWHIAQVEPSWLTAYLAAAQVNTVSHYSPCDFSDVTLQDNPSEIDLPLAIFAKQLPMCSFNLLQGRFKVKKQGSPFWQNWRTPLIAASVALVCSLSLKGVELYQLKQQLVVAEASIINQYQAAYPESKIRINLIRNQVKNKLQQVEGGSDAGFLVLLQNIAPVLNQVNGFQPQSIRYDMKRNELRLRAIGKDFQSFSQVKQELEKQGLSVDQGGLNNDGDTVVGEIKIRSQA
ncbi:type II secretion system protein GspL [Pseudoalteromonas tunicata]|uniref:Type II secretion system protein L n=1 Tax=Pseudoalteromonas tunicata D2 TaxID=87626 RepID=A4CES9_9GAMM|nr:type II secretion system protein GspL [Pseudoalteromonas tunicata]ATC96069.1 general secretion pathway protein L [Pseudoalteromonas tunicata]AXT31598.1 type II secretion system protein GspL [Pseudoalteromonas tunicata]EAR26808.1 putative general secretion pathway protein L [Pseudoalteromonas tunicata D2]